MTYLLDTNTCIVYINGRSAEVAHNVGMINPQDIVVCSIVKAELFAGAMKTRHPERTLAHQQRFVNLFVSFPFDDIAADIYAEIRANLEIKGIPIGPYDLQITAIALANNMTLITHNTREFSRVVGLQLEDWQEAL